MADKKPNPLGRLKTFGLEHPWQVAFLLPSGYNDFRNPIDDFSLFSGGMVGAEVLLKGQIKDYRSSIDAKANRVVGTLTDKNGRSVAFCFFGEIKSILAQLNEISGECFFAGKIDYFNNRPQLKEPQIVHPYWAGRIRPCYPSKTRVITPDMSRHIVTKNLKEGAISKAIEWLVKEIGLPEETLLKFTKTRAPSLTVLLEKMHLPDTPEQGLRAQVAVERIAALGMVRKGIRGIQSGQSLLVDFANPLEMLGAVPFRLTEEQSSVAMNMVLAFKRGAKHVMLSGDVGTGKTVVYGAVIAAAMQRGARVACLLPNEPLAEQIHRELTAYWPQFSALLVNGSTSKSTDLTVPQLLIGTSALLFREIGRRDVVVVDEQQKFARHQREQLLGQDSVLIESTATCVPRTQALIQFGGVEVFRLTQCHVKKEIKTRIWSEADKAVLFKETRSMISQGGKLLVVYPKREASDTDAGDSESIMADLPSAEEAFEQWSRLFPGMVRHAHGGRDDQDNLAAIADVREGRAQILVATSLVEVGITIPGLKQVIVVHAERFGLSTLHQIRGRVARDGGVGRCDLFLPRRVKDDSFARLAALTRVSDGFELAIEDMKIRGFGDLSEASSKQTGADDCFLFGRILQIDMVEAVMREVEESTVLKSAKIN